MQRSTFLTYDLIPKCGYLLIPELLFFIIIIIVMIGVSGVMLHEAVSELQFNVEKVRIQSARFD